MVRRVALVIAIGVVSLGAPLVADDTSAPDWTPTEITQLSVDPGGGITLNGKLTTLGAFKIECKRLRRVDGALDYVRSTDGDEPHMARRVAQIMIATGVWVRFVGSEVPKDFQAAVPKVPL